MRVIILHFLDTQSRDNGSLVKALSDGASRTTREITDFYNSTFDTDLSTNRVQPQVTKAVKNGALDRTVVKGVVYFVSK